MKRSPFRLRLAVVVAGLVLALGSGSALAATSFFQGFEVDTVDWSAGTIRVPSGNNGVPSATGGYHAEVTSTDFTRWGGYESTFPAGGYRTAVDVYLDVDGGYANDTRFDFSSAINNPAGTHRRDFVFNVGFYDDTDATGSGNRFVVSASNNAGRGNAFPKNPGRDPFAITSTGWYTFEHRFYDSGGGVLAVDLSIIDGSGAVLHTWTLSDPSDIIGTTVGGHRYGWFASNEFPFLAIDNTRLDSGPALPTSKDECKDGGWQNFWGRTFKNQGDCIQYVNTGK